MANQMVECSVSQCFHNERGQRCSLPSVTIRPGHERSEAETLAWGVWRATFCASFVEK